MKLLETNGICDGEQVLGDPVDVVGRHIFGAGTWAETALVVSDYTITVGGRTLYQGCPLN
jgi:hypothetical protein